MFRRLCWSLVCLLLALGVGMFAQERGEYIILDDYPIHDAPNEDARQLALTGVSFIDVALNVDADGFLIIENGWVQVTFTTPAGREVIAWIHQEAVSDSGEATETPPYTGDYVIVDGRRIEVTDALLINGEHRLGEIITFDEIRSSFSFNLESLLVLDTIPFARSRNTLTAFRAISTVFIGYEDEFGLMQFAFGWDTNSEARSLLGVPSGRAQGFHFDDDQRYIFGSEFYIEMSEPNFRDNMLQNGFEIGDNVILFIYVENNEEPELAESEHITRSPRLNLNSSDEGVSTLEMLGCFTTRSANCDVTNGYTQEPQQGAVLFYTMFLKQ